MPAPELLVGRALGGRYRVEEVIGQGGMSVVYRARDERLGRVVALKVIALPAPASEREELRARFRREAGSSARIPPHPNVVQVYDYGTDAELDLDFIVMELLDGHDLKWAIRHAPPGVDESLRILREAARGLAAGHRAGIVHRDVKPANVFLSGGNGLPTVKILDFGIAKALRLQPDDDLTRTGQLPHSPAYASPEQLEPGRPLTPASDVYQLGLVAYELLAGERPFSPAERERRAGGVAGPLPARGRWTEVPPGVRATIERALHADPDRRYRDAAEFAEALTAAAEAPDAVLAAAGAGPDDDLTLLAEETIPEVAPPPREPPPGAPGARTPRSGRALQLVGAAVLVILGFWAISSLGSGGGGIQPAAVALDLSGMDEEFRPLEREAVENLREQAFADAGPDEAAAVGRVILDLHQSWVRGELERHISHYAAEVDFYQRADYPRAGIARERAESLARFPEREVTIEHTAINFPEPGVARALIDKSWEFGGGEERWEGASRQELILRRQDGRWRVISERDLEVYRDERS